MIHLVIITGVAVGVAIFALQNPEPVMLRFLIWRVEGAPLAAVILGTWAAGALVVGAASLAQRLKLQSRIRYLESRLRAREESRGPAVPKSGAGAQSAQVGGPRA